MKKDMKIGMLVGLVVAAAALLYVCTRPALSPEARMLRQNSHITRVQSGAVSVNLSPPAPTPQPAEPPAPSSGQAAAAENTQPPRPSEPVEATTQQPNQVDSEPAFVEKTYEARRFYIVRGGDTLSKISSMYYGTPNKWYKIFEANRNVLDNPDVLKLGMKLYIPQ
jgi:nucleoid-associated protein YgaU